MVLPVTALQIDQPDLVTIGIISGSSFFRIFQILAGSGVVQAPIDLTSCTAAFSVKDTYTGTVYNAVSGTVLSGTAWAITVTNQGSGYTSAPVVGFTGGGGGSGAAAIAIVAVDQVSPTVTIGSAGSGYTSAPSVTIVGGNGSGATAVAVLTGDAVSSVLITNQGAGYTSAPTIVFSGGGGSGAAATAAIGVVTAVLLTSLGSGYASVPGITFTGGGGTAAAATGSITAATMGLISVELTPSQSDDLPVPAGSSASSRDITNAGVWDIRITDGSGNKLTPLGGPVTLTRSAQ